MTPTLFLLRVTDALSLSLASTSIALTLSDERGVTAYSQFVSVSVLGGALGGVVAFVTLNLLRRRAPARTSAIVSAAARVVLALAFAGMLSENLALLYVTGFLLTLTSVALVSMFHSLTSISTAGLRDRTSLLAATATGGLLGAPLAGTIVEAHLATQLVCIQAVGVTAGLVVAFRFHRAFAGRALPPPVVRATQWRLLRPIAWRVPIIAGLSFSLGSLAPGVLTDLWSPQIGGFAAGAYLTGAVTGATILRTADRKRRLRAIDSLRNHRWWFLPTSVGTLLWLFMLGPIWASLLATLVAGIVLHLVQAGFEQAAADLGEAEQAGPNVVLIHSMAALAVAVSLTVIPRAIDWLGLAPVVLGVSVALGGLALLDAIRACACHVTARTESAPRES